MAERAIKPGGLGEGLPAWMRRMHRHKGLIVPLGFVMLLGVLLVPLPPMMMDLLIVFNIALAVIILLTTIYMSKPAGLQRLPLAAPGDDDAAPRAEHRVHPAHPDRRRRRARGSNRRRRARHHGVRPVRRGRLALRRHRDLPHPRHRAVRRDHQGRQDASARSPPGSRWTRCPASRWPSTRTSTPASSTRPTRGAAGRRSPRRPTSSAPWTVRASSCEATPSRASSSRSSMSPAGSPSASLIAAGPQRRPPRSSPNSPSATA